MSAATTTTHTHPRRRPLSMASPPSLPSSADASLDFSLPTSARQASVEKSATFHFPSPPPREGIDPIINFPSLPRRMPTSSHALSELVSSSSENRVAGVLAQLESNLPQLHVAQPEADYALPPSSGAPARRSSFLGQFDDPTDFRQQRERDSSRRRHQDLDSGIGSSIHTNTVKTAQEVTNNTQVSAITRSFSSMTESGPEVQIGQGLSKHAQKQIHKNLVLPLLNHQSSKDFRELIKDTSGRLNKREYACLRDVEKALLLLAPEHKTSPRSYIAFCETLIQCLHTTASRLSERERTRPADKPYTNAYFLDLVGQIQQYAANMAQKRASRNSSAAKAGEDLGYSSGEELELVGGLSKNGRPAELVRRKGDQMISVATGEPYSVEESAAPILTQEQEDAERSMARRRKDAPPEPIRTCPQCPKQFKRKCDLTKHMKGHERAFKCQVASCSYAKQGFPNEKERDRHMNDRHSANPKLFDCRFCDVYKSKRESNMKQHMEKAHQWTYVRTKNNKNNGKSRAGAKAKAKGKAPAQATPDSDMLSTPASHLLSTPASSIFSDFSESPAVNTPAMNNADTVFNLRPYDPMSNTFQNVTPAFLENGQGMPYNGVQPLAMQPSLSAFPSPVSEQSLMYNNGGSSTMQPFLSHFPTPDSEATHISPQTPIVNAFSPEVHMTDPEPSELGFSVKFTEFVNNLEEMDSQQANEMWSEAGKFLVPTGVDESPFMTSAPNFTTEADQQFAAIPAAPTMGTMDDTNFQPTQDFELYGPADTWQQFYNDADEDMQMF